MADWTDLDVNSLLPGEPLTSAIALAYEENPRAIAEQADGAPKIADKTVAGTGTVTISGLDDFGGLWVRGQAVDSGADVTLGDVSVEYSTNDGSTFSSSTTLGSISLSAGPGDNVAMKMDAEFFIDFASAAYKIILSGMTSADAGSSVVDSDYSTGTISGLDLDVTDIRISGLTVLFATPQGGESAV